MSLPTPEPGLVIRYAYLWLSEYRAGREEGVKDRPCAVVLASRDHDGEIKVLVLPVTHSPPSGGIEALELPPQIKRHLGLDTDRSWVVLSESNLFDWPGPDLRRVDDRDNSSIAYGVLPPRLFAEIRRRYVALARSAPTTRVPRTE